jgi:hypothetical protein
MTQSEVLDTIDTLTAANRRERDPDREARLVELRRDACADQRERSPRGVRSWLDERTRRPRRVKDVFADVPGLPEVAATELTPTVLRSAVLRRGGILVRGLIDQSRVDVLVDDIDRAFDAHDAYRSDTTGNGGAPWFVPFDPGAAKHLPREWIRDGGGVLAVDSPRALFDLIEVFQEAGVRDLVSAYLGERPVILAKKLTLRRISPPEHAVDRVPDWHQDGAFMGRDIRSINVWLSLSHSGIDAPGLDIVARRLDDLAPTGTDGANFDWSVSDALVNQIAPGAIVRPVFEPGDALLFDHMLLHRTALHSHMTKTRYAIEAWFAAPSSYPVDEIPIVY